jgi:hypothetical protein
MELAFIKWTIVDIKCRWEYLLILQLFNTFIICYVCFVMHVNIILTFYFVNCHRRLRLLNLFVNLIFRSPIIFIDGYRIEFVDCPIVFHYLLGCNFLWSLNINCWLTCLQVGQLLLISLQWRTFVRLRAGSMRKILATVVVIATSCTWKGLAGNIFDIGL